MRSFWAHNPSLILVIFIVTFILVGHYCFNFYPSTIHLPPSTIHQKALVERYAQLGVHGDALGTISALTLGYKGDLNKEVIGDFRRSGAAHILAVSGLHTGIIYAILLYLLTCFKQRVPLYEERFKRCLISGVCIVCLWAYAYLTGLTPSVVRSVIMFTLAEVAHMLYRERFSLNVVFFSAAIILAFRPTDLFSVSFQLSYAAVIAIVLCSPLFSFPSLDRIRPKALSKTVRSVVGLVTVSLAAQLGTLPLTLYYFHQMSNYFLLTNMIVIPLATVLVPLGFATLVFGDVPYVGDALVWLLQWGTDIMMMGVHWVQSLPGAFVQI